MGYEVIDKELKIEACNIGDLTLEQIQSFLRLWGDNSAISTLTLFLKNDGTVVLNKNNEEYAFYKDVSYCYLKGTEGDREEMRANLSEELQETLNVLESAVKMRKTDEMLEMLRYNPCEENGVSFGILKKIFEEYGSGAYGMFKILNLGVIQGKRIERARRKKTA